MALLFFSKTELEWRVCLSTGRLVPISSSFFCYIPVASHILGPHYTFFFYKKAVIINLGGNGQLQSTCPPGSCDALTTWGALVVLHLIPWFIFFNSSICSKSFMLLICKWSLIMRAITPPIWLFALYWLSC